MKMFKLFFVGLMIGLSVGECAHAAAAEEERKEASEASSLQQEQAALDEWIQQNLAQVGSEKFDPRLAGLIKDLMPPFEGESVRLGEEYGVVRNVLVAPDQRYFVVTFGDMRNEKILVVYDALDFSEKLVVPLKGVIIGYHKTDVKFIHAGGQYYFALALQPEYVMFPLGHGVHTLLFDLSESNPAAKKITGSFAGVAPGSSGYIVRVVPNKMNLGLYDIRNLDKPVFEFPLNEKFIEFSPDGDFISTKLENKNKFVFYDVQKIKNQAPKIIEGIAARFSPGGEYAYVDQSDDSVKFYNLPNFDEKFEFPDSAWEAMFSPGDRYVVLGTNDMIFYSLETGRKVATFQPKVRAAYFSPDGQGVFIKENFGTDYKLYNMNDTFKLVSETSFELPGIREINFSPDGQCMEISTFGQFYIITIKDSTRLLSTVGTFHNFLNGCRYALSSSHENGIKVWDLGKIEQRLATEKKEREVKEREEKQKEEERKARAALVGQMPTGWRERFQNQINRFSQRPIDEYFASESEPIDETPQEF